MCSSISNSFCCAVENVAQALHVFGCFMSHRLQAFGSGADADLLSQCKPLVGRTFLCVETVLRRTRSTVGTWIFMPILAASCYFVIGDYLVSLSEAAAMYCLCDISSTADEKCLAQQLLST